MSLHGKKFKYKNHGDQKKWHHSFQVMKRKNCQPRILYLVNISFRNIREIKTLGERKLQEFVASRPILKEWLKKVPLNKKRKDKFWSSSKVKGCNPQQHPQASRAETVGCVFPKSTSLEMQLQWNRI